MKIKDIFGRERSLNLKKYRIDWQKKSASIIQSKVKAFLYPYWATHIVFEEFRIPSCLFRIDILNLTKRIAVEIDGNQHDKFTPFFHGNRSGFEQAIKKDHQKMTWLEKNNIKLVRVKRNEVDKLTLEFFERFDANII